VTLYDRQILHLDKIGLAILENTRKIIHRAELIRVIVDKVTGAMDTHAPGFDKKVNEFFPCL